MSATERLNEFNRKQQQQNEIDFLNALKAFRDTARNLLDVWLKADHTGDYFNADYPFKDSFDSIVHSINDWHETQSNTGFSGELKPESKFENSILESESKNFPKVIDVTTETGRNPLGRFELVVINGEDLEGVFYYDDETERQKDIDTLENFFEVNFI